MKETLWISWGGEIEIEGNSASPEIKYKVVLSTKQSILGGRLEFDTEDQVLLHLAVLEELSLLKNQQRHPLSNDIATLYLMAPIDFWQNLILFFGVVGFCITKFDDF